MNIELIHLLFFFWGFCVASVIYGVMANYCDKAIDKRLGTDKQRGRIRRIKEAMEVGK